MLKNLILYSCFASFHSQSDLKIFMFGTEEITVPKNKALLWARAYPGFCSGEGHTTYTEIALENA